MNALIYDAEIINMVPMRNEPVDITLTYCKGWEDHAGMGVSVVCCYDYVEDRYRVFTKENWQGLAHLFHVREVLVGFNNKRFDNTLLKACGVCESGKWESKSYDVLAEMWRASGLNPDEFNFKTHSGFSLDVTAKVNLNEGKTGEGGAMAPALWQRGAYGQVIDYCLQDVKLTRRLFDRVRNMGGLRSPKDPLRFMEMRRP